MATITLVANTSYSDLTVADGDTIDLAGFRLTFDINPTQENVIVHSPGTGGTVDLPSAIDVFDFPGWEFTAGSANLLPSVALAQTVGGTWVGGVGGHAITTNHGTITGSVRGSATTTSNGCGTNNGDVQGQIIGGGIPGAYGIQANNGIVTGEVIPDVGPGIRFHYGAAIGPVSPGGISQYRNHTLICNGPVWEDTTSSPYNKVILSLFGPLHPNATVAPGIEVIVLSGDVAAAIANGQRPNQPTRITPGVAPRLSFVALDSDGVPVQDLAVADIASASYVTVTNGVRSSLSAITLSSKVADTASHSTGQLVTIRPSEGWYAIDAPAGAALSTADYAELAVTLADSSRLVYPTMHGIDLSVSGVPAATRTELATELARVDVAVSTRNAVTPPTVAQLNARTLPTADYFSAATDTVARVTLVDTVTANTDMRGTDGANTTTPPTAASIATAVWAASTRTLTAISDSAGVGTLLSRITGLLRTKAQADAATSAVLDEIDARTLPSAEYMPASDYTAPLNAMQTQSAAAAALTAYDPPTRAEATADKDEVIGVIEAPDLSELIAILQGADVVQVAMPNSQGNLVLTQGDTYDGIANPRAQWSVAVDYTDGWEVMLTIRSKDDAVILAAEGEVTSPTLITVALDGPTGIEFEGCPGVWQGKFDVQLSKGASRATIAMGVCYVNEDQTR